MAGGANESGDPEFQIAPMVDVLLVLLIFFMSITCAQVLKVDRTIKLPVSKEAVKKDTNRPEAVVDVHWDPDSKAAAFSFENVTYLKPTELVPKLKAARLASEQRAPRGPAMRLVVRGDREAPAGKIADVINAGGAAGLSDIAFSTVNKD